MENLHDRIETNPAVIFGKPVIKGTRITVESILDELASGYNIEEVLKAHPNLNEADIYAALQYASSILKNEKIYTTAL